MSSRELPSNPNSEQLRRQAKELLRSLVEGDAAARTAFRRHHPDFASEATGRADLAGAQLVLAREYGFPSWKKLMDHVSDSPEKRLADFLAAVLHGRHGTAKDLLAQDPSIPKRSFHAACVVGDAEEVGHALTRDPSVARAKWGKEGIEPLYFVGCSCFFRESADAAEGILHVARLLLESGADVNAGYTPELWPETTLRPLYPAAGESGNGALTRLLLEAGAIVDDGESIYHAAQHFHLDCLDALLDHGVDLSGPVEPWGNSPLYFQLGHSPGDAHYETALKGIHWLLDHGADPNVRNRPHEHGVRNRDETSLHAAVRGSYPAAIIEKLIDCGADVDAKTSDGLTAYAMAMRYGNSAAAEVLSRRGASTSMSRKDEFLAACASGDGGKAGEILAGHPDVLKDLDDSDRSVLVQLTVNGNHAGVKALLDAGFDPMAKGSEGASGLHWAAWHGMADLVELFLGYEPDLEMEDDTHHSSVLGWAAHGAGFHPNPKGDYPRVVRLLLEAGAIVSGGVQSSVPEVKSLLDDWRTRAAP